MDSVPRLLKRAMFSKTSAPHVGPRLVNVGSSTATLPERGAQMPEPTFTKIYGRTFPGAATNSYRAGLYIKRNEEEVYSGVPRWVARGQKGEKLMSLNAQDNRPCGQLRTWLMPLAALVLFTFWAWPASASLGGDVNSVQADQAKMKAAQRTTQAKQAYTVQEITTPYGTVVREYVSPAGQVFGVAWRGPFLPDFQQLFGNYYGQFAQAVQAQHAAQPRRSRNAPLAIDQPGLVVHSGGHTRAYAGQAYVPDLLPQNVNPSDVK